MSYVNWELEEDADSWLIFPSKDKMLWHLVDPHSVWQKYTISFTLKPGLVCTTQYHGYHLWFQQRSLLARNTLGRGILATPALHLHRTIIRTLGRKLVAASLDFINLYKSRIIRGWGRLGFWTTAILDVVVGTIQLEVIWGNRLSTLAIRAVAEDLASCARKGEKGGQTRVQQDSSHILGSVERHRGIGTGCC